MWRWNEDKAKSGSIMNIIKSVNQTLFYNEEIRSHAVQTIAMTTLASICGYAGTFFFTNFPAETGAFYLGSVALVSFVAYQSLDKLKEQLESPSLRKIVGLVALLQIPFAFYYLPKYLPLNLASTAELEILAAAAHFAAIPIFFHLAVTAWNEPSVTNIASATGVLLPLANGLRYYAKSA
ncbi:hypothetical protein PNK_2029 [Candidatus Protochlamydia naegleriophila]|uniref:Uncharacterized protein n=2 Tax=Candidatus Protochlamydia naegleriophila TaxID=389348 RepID=A0A0U5ETU8_9BACT|nr:hypothetical protein PNK_2029 [Candidatus Protochlamydia naegleriophila]